MYLSPFVPLGNVSRAALFSCSVSRAGYSIKKPAPKISPCHNSTGHVEWLTGQPIKQPEGKLIFQHDKDLRLVGKLQMNAEVPPPLLRTGSGLGRECGRGWRLHCLKRQANEILPLLSPRSSAGEAACPYPPSLSCALSAERLGAVPGASLPTAAQTNGGAETLPLPGAASLSAKQHCPKAALQREEITLR